MSRRPSFASRIDAAPTLALVTVAFSLVVSLGGGGCYAPRLENGGLKCAGGSACPRGFYCAEDNRCWRAGEYPPPRDGGIEGSSPVVPDGSERPAPMPPAVVEPASASPSPVDGTTTALSVLGDDPLGEDGLTYTWSVVGPAPGLVGFADNNSNSAKNTTAIFTTAGQYSFHVVIQNRDTLTSSSMVDVTVHQRINDLALTPPMATVALGGMQQFKATAFDQFGTPLTTAVMVKWLLAGGCGVVNDVGLFQAAPAVSGSCIVTASSGAASANATVSVGTAPPIVLTPVEDAYVDDGFPDKNFGSTTNLLVKTQANTTNNRIAFLRFSLAGVPLPITGGKLLLFGHSNVATHMDGLFAVPDAAWTEGTITWKTKPALGPRLSRANVTTAPKYHEWDLTAFIQARVAAGDASVSLAVQMEGSAGEAPDTFDAREATNKPQLVLTR